MLIKNLKTKQVFIVPDGTMYAKTAYEVITKDQLEKEKAMRIAAMATQEKKTITKPSPKKKPTKASKKKLNTKKRK